jgi:hypothetical protein
MSAAKGLVDDVRFFAALRIAPHSRVKDALVGCQRTFWRQVHPLAPTASGIADRVVKERTRIGAHHSMEAWARAWTNVYSSSTAASSMPLRLTVSSA